MGRDGPREYLPLESTHGNVRMDLKGKIRVLHVSCALYETLNCKTFFLLYLRVWLTPAPGERTVSFIFKPERKHTEN